MSEKNPEIVLRQREAYSFEVTFGGSIPPLVTDEPPPLGTHAGPSPVELLLAAVGSCLSSSLHFAMNKFHETPGPIRTRVSATVGRNEKGRLRVLGITVTLRFAAEAAKIAHLERILGQFEEFCTVGASVAQGIPLTTRVEDGTGRLLKGPAEGGPAEGGPATEAAPAPSGQA